MGGLLILKNKMAGVLKRVTGLTGLKVVENPHQTLSVLYDKIMRTCEKMPEEAAYRKSTAALTQERLNIVKSDRTVAGIEQKINCGQAEELVLQAERELSLARKMLMWKAWEPLVEEAPKNQ